MTKKELKIFGFKNLKTHHKKEVCCPMFNRHTVTLMYFPKQKFLYVTIPMVNENGHMHPYELTKMQGENCNVLTIQNLIDWLEMSHEDLNLDL